jgi:hypothetical protein
MSVVGGTSFGTYCRSTTSTIPFFNSQAGVPKMASRISLSRPNLINTPLEEGGELSVWIFCVVAPISSYEAYQFSKQILQLDSGPASTVIFEINFNDNLSLFTTGSTSNALVLLWKSFRRLAFVHVSSMSQRTLQ